MKTPNLCRQAALVLCYLAPEKIFLIPNLKFHRYAASYKSSYEVWLCSSMALLGFLQFVIIFRTDTGLILHLWSGLVRLPSKISHSLLNIVFNFADIYSNPFWPFEFSCYATAVWYHLKCNMQSPCSITDENIKSCQAYGRPLSSVIQCILP